jgi:N-acetylneuraminic acid mutarotase
MKHKSNQISASLVFIFTIIFSKNLVAQSWETKAPLNVPRHGACATTLNGLIYLFGGGNTQGQYTLQTEVYNPANNTWILKAPIPSPRGEMACATVNGKIYVMGGYNPNLPSASNPPGALNIVEEYDPATDTWTTKAPMPTYRSTISASVINGKIYVIGDWPTASGELYIYDPILNTWSAGPSCPTGRMNANSSVSFGNDLFFIGGKIAGFNGNNTSLLSNKNEMFNTATGIWETKSNIPQPTFNGSATIVNDKIHYLGGIIGYQPYTNTSNHFVYDIPSDSWSGSVNLTFQRDYHVSVYLNSQLYVIGGRDSADLNSLSLVEALTMCANDLTIAPANNELQTGSTAIFTTTTSDPSPSFVWQSDFGQGFQTLNNFGNYSGANTATLNIANIQLPNHTQPIRVISSSGNCIDTSDVAIINILDTCITNVTVYDTLFTTVTDTLIINATITGLNPPSNQNTIKVFPNPANTHITVDYGNFASMNGYTLAIVNSIGQTVFTTAINQQTSYLDLSTWTGTGIYYVQLIDIQNNTIENRKIVIQ